MQVGIVAVLHHLPSAICHLLCVCVSIVIYIVCILNYIIILWRCLEINFMFIYSPHRHNHAQSDDSTSNVASDTDVQISPEFSNQSTIERAVLDLTISGNSWLCISFDLPYEM